MIKRYCDRCGREIIIGMVPNYYKDYGIFRDTAGPYNKDTSQRIDLCRICSEELGEWFEAGSGGTCSE